MHKLGVVAFHSAQKAVTNRSLWVPGWSGLILFLKKKKNSIFVLKIKRGSLYFKILDNVYMKKYRKIHKFSYIAYWKKQAGVGKNNFFIHLCWPIRMIFNKFNKVKMYCRNKKEETKNKLIDASWPPSVQALAPMWNACYDIWRVGSHHQREHGTFGLCCSIRNKTRTRAVSAKTNTNLHKHVT